MKITLNVGRDVANGCRLPSCVVQLETCRALRRLELDEPIHCTWRQSQTEATLVAAMELSANWDPTTLLLCVQDFMHCLAISLEQDCVAVLLEMGHGTEGHLIGPRADKWAPFNEAYFLRA